MRRRYLGRGWSLVVKSDDWALPLKIWWWTPAPDRALGVQLLNAHLQWERRETR